jgi:hypothetical protein
MAKHQTVRLRPTILEADLSACTALIDMQAYQPANLAFSKESAVAKREAMRAAQEEEIRLRGALQAARDAANTAEWDFHNTILGAKNEVIAQFGNDSEEVQALGLKRKSEYKRPGPK